MPLYEYECEKCKMRFTVLKRLEEISEVEKCPYCEGNAKKVVSTFGTSCSVNQWGGCTTFG